jgi:hypothetical protein
VAVPYPAFAWLVAHPLPSSPNGTPLPVRVVPSASKLSRATVRGSGSIE